MNENGCSAPTLATELFASAAQLPIVSPHGHVPIGVLAGADNGWRDPAALFVTGDHYVIRMLYSIGTGPKELGMQAAGEGASAVATSREVWQKFCQARRAFLATPTGFWIDTTMREMFGLDGWPEAEQAEASYDRVSETLEKLSALELLRSQNVSYISTTDSAAADLSPHESLRKSVSTPEVAPTFRPDALAKINDPGWGANLNVLAERAAIEITDFDSFLGALRARRHQFISCGASASDHGMRRPRAHRLSRKRVKSLFDRALRGVADAADSREFESHLLLEHAAMSADDGLVMQLHAGSHRDHHSRFVGQYGPDTGSDIPIAVDFTGGLRQLLNDFGANPAFRLVLFTLDESTYTRELAPLAGHYPAVRLGPPWWFLDSAQGIRRYLDAVVETAGLLNLAGFNDDTRNIATVAARHSLWRSTTAAWLSDKVSAHSLSEADAHWAMRLLSHDAAVDTYRLASESVGD